MSSIPGLSTKLVSFDTLIVDLTDQLDDPVEVLFGVQLSSDINAALDYCEKQIENPLKTHLILITDLFEGGYAKSMLARAFAIKQSGVNLIVLLAFSDSGHPAYEAKCWSARQPWVSGLRLHSRSISNDDGLGLHRKGSASLGRAGRCSSYSRVLSTI